MTRTLSFASFVALGMFACGCASPPAPEPEQAAAARSILAAAHKFLVRVAEPDEQESVRLAAQALADWNEKEPNASHSRSSYGSEFYKNIGPATRHFKRVFNDYENLRLNFCRFDGFTAEQGLPSNEWPAEWTRRGEPGWYFERPYTSWISIDGIRHYRKMTMPGLTLLVMRNLETFEVSVCGTNGTPVTAEVREVSPRLPWWRLIRTGSSSWTLWNFESHDQKVDYFTGAVSYAVEEARFSGDGGVALRIQGEWNTITPYGDLVPLGLKDLSESAIAARREQLAKQFSGDAQKMGWMPDAFNPPSNDLWSRRFLACSEYQLAILAGASRQLLEALTLERAKFMLQRHGATGAVGVIDWMLGVPQAEAVLSGLGWTRATLTKPLMELVERESDVYRYMYASRGERLGRMDEYVEALPAYLRRLATHAPLPGEVAPSKGLHPNAKYSLTYAIVQSGRSKWLLRPFDQGKLPSRVLDQVIDATKEFKDLDDRIKVQELLDGLRGMYNAARAAEVLATVMKSLEGREVFPDIRVGPHPEMSRVWPFVDETGQTAYRTADLRTVSKATYRAYVWKWFLEMKDAEKQGRSLAELSRGTYALSRGKPDALDLDVNRCVAALERLWMGNASYASVKINAAQLTSKDASVSSWQIVQQACVSYHTPEPKCGAWAPLEAAVRASLASIPEERHSEILELAAAFWSVTTELKSLAQRNDADTARYEERMRVYRAEQARKEAEEQKRKQAALDFQALRDRISREAAAQPDSSYDSGGAGWSVQSQMQQWKAEARDKAWSNYMSSGDRRDYNQYQRASYDYRRAGGR